MTAEIDAPTAGALGPRTARFGVVLACFFALMVLYIPFPWWVNLAVPLVYWAFAHYVEHRRLDELRGGRMAVFELAIGLAWGCLLEVASILPGGAVHLDLAYLATASALGIVFYAACEELIFRGLLFAELDPRLGTVWALAISAVAFALAHGMFDPIELVILSVDGVVFAAAFLLTRRLWLPIGMHGALNLTIEMTGSTGQLIWPLYIVLQIAAAAILLVLAQRRGRLLRRRSGTRARRRPASEATPPAVAADENANPASPNG